MIRLTSILYVSIAFAAVSCGKKASSSKPVEPAAPPVLPESQKDTETTTTTTTETSEKPANKPVTSTDTPVTESEKPVTTTETPIVPPETKIVPKNPAQLVGTWAASLLSDNLCTTFYRFDAGDKLDIDLLCRIPGKQQLGLESHSFQVLSKDNTLTLTEMATSCKQAQGKAAAIRFMVLAAAPAQNLSAKLILTGKSNLTLHAIQNTLALPLRPAPQDYLGHPISSGCFVNGRLSAFEAN